MKEIVSIDFIDIIKVRWLKFTVLASHIYCKPQIAINGALDIGLEYNVFNFQLLADFFLLKYLS